MSLWRAPSCLFECYDDDAARMDPYLFYLYKRKQKSVLVQDDYLKMVAMCEIIANEECKEHEKQSHQFKQKRKRENSEPHETRWYKDPIDGSLRQFGPWDTDWYRRYIESPAHHSKRFHRLFRRRFRCSYESFLKHVEEVKKSELFSRWADGSKDATGKEATPIELLVLGVLRYLGRGWCFDDLEEQTCVSQDVHRVFPHVYLLWGSTTMFQKYVVLPADAKQAQEWATEYGMAGFTGAMGSMDATHIGMLKCQYRLKQFNISWKLNMPSRTYNTTVTNRRRILHTTQGHPGRWNDQTLHLYDELAKILRDGTKYNDAEFVLLRRLP
ncbi:hypothetical protein ACHAWF_000807, partial [Thalassiosira exigua]